MPTPNYATKEEMLDSLLSVIRLKLWFVWEWLSKHPDEDFQSVVQSRVDIYRKTVFNAGHLDFVAPADSPKVPEWADILKELEGHYAKAKRKGGFSAFETLSMKRLEPLVAGRSERDAEDFKEGKDTAAYQCGSLRYNLSPDKDAPQRMGFHIANACYPGSPFDDRNYFPACFMVLMKQCEEKFGATEIGTHTWLNSLPKWLELFPKQWQDNLSAPGEDVRWHYGFWGQFLTSRKTFNKKLGEQFRKTGRMPFLPRGSWCSIEEMRKHLRDNYSL